MRTRRTTAVLALGLVLVGAMSLAGCKDDKKSNALSPAAAPEKLYTPGAQCAATAPTTTAAQPLPDLLLPCLTGGEGSINLRNLGGKPMVVALWASWCGPCLKELPLIQKAYASRKVDVLGINTENPGTENVQLLGDLKLTFPSVYDLAGRALSRLPGVRRALPITVFVDPSGEVRKIYQGVPFDEKTFAAALTEYLGVA